MHTKTMIDIQNNLKRLKNQILEYEFKYHRPANSVSLLAASKKQTISKILMAYEAGQRAFGENYVQEALEKMQALADKELEWHFIGAIQSNKTKKIAEHFSWAHCLSSEKIAQRLNDQRPTYLPPLNVCIEVNISHETSKSGILPSEVKALAEFCLELPQLKLRGLMAIPAIHHDFAEQGREFQKLSSLYHELKNRGLPLDTLSMGMSGDFEAAIAEGATIVRIGEAIFGKR